MLYEVITILKLVCGVDADEIGLLEAVEIDTQLQILGYHVREREIPGPGTLGRKIGIRLGRRGCLRSRAPESRNNFV